MLKFVLIKWFFLNGVCETRLFATPWPEVPHSLPAPKRECGVFGPGMAKNSIRTTGIKLASRQLVYATLAFGSGSLGASYTISCLFCVRKVAVLHTACAKVAHALINLLSRTPCVKQLLRA